MQGTTVKLHLTRDKIWCKCDQSISKRIQFFSLAYYLHIVCMLYCIVTLLRQRLIAFCRFLFDNLFYCELFKIRSAQEENFTFYFYTIKHEHANLRASTATTKGTSALQVGSNYCKSRKKKTITTKQTKSLLILLFSKFWANDKLSITYHSHTCIKLILSNGISNESKSVKSVNKIRSFNQLLQKYFYIFKYF